MINNLRYFTPVSYIVILIDLKLNLYLHYKDKKNFARLVRMILTVQTPILMFSHYPFCKTSKICIKLPFKFWNQCFNAKKKNLCLNSVDAVSLLVTLLKPCKYVQGDPKKYL